MTNEEATEIILRGVTYTLCSCQYKTETLRADCMICNNWRLVPDLEYVLATIKLGLPTPPSASDALTKNRLEGLCRKKKP